MLVYGGLEEVSKDATELVSTGLQSAAIIPSGPEHLFILKRPESVMGGRSEGARENVMGEVGPSFENALKNYFLKVVLKEE